MYIFFIKTFNEKKKKNIKSLMLSLLIVFFYKILLASFLRSVGHCVGLEGQIRVGWTHHGTVQRVPAAATTQDAEITAGHLEVVVIDKRADTQQQEGYV